MAVVCSYTPPKRNAAVAMHAAVEAAEHAAAEALLDAAQQLVPVEEGVLKASGRTVRDNTGQAITFGKDDDGDETHAPSNQYAIPQHEDGSLNHPNGGQWKFLETPMHQAHEAILVAGAVELKRAFE
jgi:CO/xanthine dehydrogenase Mo-binding subunit